MPFYDSLDVGHTRVTNFDSVSVADLVQWVFFWEVLLNKPYECSTNFGSDTAAEWRVKIRNFTFSTSMGCVASYL